MIAATKAQLPQTEGEMADMLQILAPGHPLPDPELLFAEGHITSALVGLGHENLGQGFAAQLNHRFLRL